MIMQQPEVSCSFTYFTEPINAMLHLPFGDGSVGEDYVNTIG